MTTLRIVVVPEKVRSKDGVETAMFAAIGLEHFLVGQGDTPYAALDALDRAVVTTLAAVEELGGHGLGGIKPAPACIQALYDAAGAQAMPQARIGDAIELRPVLAHCA